MKPSFFVLPINVKDFIFCLHISRQNHTENEWEKLLTYGGSHEGLVSLLSEELSTYLVDLTETRKIFNSFNLQLNSRDLRAVSTFIERKDKTSGIWKRIGELKRCAPWESAMELFYGEERAEEKTHFDFLWDTYKISIGKLACEFTKEEYLESFENCGNNVKWIRDLGLWPPVYDVYNGNGHRHEID